MHGVAWIAHAPVTLHEQCGATPCGLHCALVQATHQSQSWIPLTDDSRQLPLPTGSQPAHAHVLVEGITWGAALAGL
jgi:hypothetical protein